MQLTEKNKARFWAKVSVRQYGCWEWNGCKHTHGYGRFYLNRRWIMAHRISYIIFNKSIPDNREIDHICRNRQCVNPDHLEAVTHKENTRRGFGPTGINAQKTNCPKCGGEYTDFGRPRGRVCVPCARIANKNHYYKNKEPYLKRSRIQRERKKERGVI